MFNVTPSIAKLQINKLVTERNCKLCAYGEGGCYTPCYIPQTDFCDTAEKIENLLTKNKEGK